MPASVLAKRKCLRKIKTKMILKTKKTLCIKICIKQHKTDTKTCAML